MTDKKSKRGGANRGDIRAEVEACASVQTSPSSASRVRRGLDAAVQAAVMSLASGLADPNEGDQDAAADLRAGRGGANRGQGRKPVKQGEKTVTLSMRLTESQREKVRARGGVAWVRDLIDRAVDR